MKKETTIKDIAKKLGIHHTTVSLALRDSPRIKESTKLLVMSTVKEMNYTQNTLALNFRNKKSKTLGIIVPNIKHYFFSQFVSLISDMAFKAGYSLMVAQSNENLAQEIQNVDSMINNRVAGIIASFSLETNQFDHFQNILDRNIPLVFFDRVPKELKAFKVSVDNFGAAYQACRLLIDHGCKRIAHINGNSLTSNVHNSRLEGYRKALTEVGYPLLPELEVIQGLSFHDGLVAAERLLNLSVPPDGLFVAGSELAMGAIKYLKRAGLRIPEDIAIVGFDNPPHLEIIDPGLTTVEQPMGYIAEEVFRLLLAQIDESLQIPEDHQLSARLILRESHLF